MKLKVIIFDIDGTLYPNLSMYIKVLPYVIKRFSLLRSFGKIRTKIRKLGEIEDYFKIQSELLAEELGVKPEEARLIIEEKIYKELEEYISRLKLFPNLRECLKTLKEHGFLLGVLSDFPVKTKMAALGLEGIWDLKISAEEVGYLKPHKKPFEKILEILKVNPEEVLYVGNSYKYDIIGAKNMGFYAAHVTIFKKNNSIADFSFYSYRKLLKWILDNNKTQ